MSSSAASCLRTGRRLSWRRMAAVVLAMTMAGASSVRAELDEWYDRVDRALSWSSADGGRRGRVSGLLDVEGYSLPVPAPGVIDSDRPSLFVPRLSMFLDAQLGNALYAFAQARVDRGFDPSGDPVRARVDEYALRWNASRDGHLTVQVGKFATVVGSWVGRHDSWSNPFITAPLVYENLTGVWDNEPPRSSGQLLAWSHVRPGLPPAILAQEKYFRVPIIWGPSYTAGIAVAGEMNRWRYAVELKNGSLSSRPQTWSPDAAHWDQPTVSGRVRYVPTQQWQFGWSASSGTFLRPSAAATLSPGASRVDYRELVVAQDVTFAWHHLQVWAEVYGARFRIPGIGNADTLAYYVEAKYKLDPWFSWALRLNQQVFGTIQDRGTAVTWGRNTWRVDAGPAFRFAAFAQLKVQYSVGRGDDRNRITHLLAAQLTLRF